MSVSSSTVSGRSPTTGRGNADSQRQERCDEGQFQGPGMR